MALPVSKPLREAVPFALRFCWNLVGVLTLALLFPVLTTFGGSTNLINWGPGLLIAGIACMLLVGSRSSPATAMHFHRAAFLSLLGLLWLRAHHSPDISHATNCTALLAFAAVGYLIGEWAHGGLSRALFTGITLATALNLHASVMQVMNPEWNLFYPQRSGGFPSGLFAHYNYSASFCLGASGLLLTAAGGETRTWKSVFSAGAVCALVTIPISLSRGGNLALAFMAALVLGLWLARAFSKSGSLLHALLPSLMMLGLLFVFAGFLVPMIGRNQGPDGFYVDGVRIDFWKAAAELSTRHPWLGGGAGSFAWEVYHVMSGLTTEPGMVHNESLQLATDFGYPALAALCVLIAIPLLRSFGNFISPTVPGSSPWVGVALVGMLFQSNFSFVFHTAPGAMLAALLLGRVCRGVWHRPDPEPTSSAAGSKDSGFLAELRERIHAWRSGRENSLPRLISLLASSPDPQWQRASYRLTYWHQTENPDELHKAIKNLATLCATESPRTRPGGSHPRLPPRITMWGVLGRTALAGLTLPLTIRGASLTQTLADAWIPVYHGDHLSPLRRFELLLRLAESRTGLGIDRMVMTAGIDCVHQFASLEARMYWAKFYRPRIMRAVPGWMHDPGTALQLAEIVGWEGDVEYALHFYDRAILDQGSNESLFMANAFKGQYLYELCLSADTAGNLGERRYYARKAAECFQNAEAAMKNENRMLPSAFSRMLRHSETFANPST